MTEPRKTPRTDAAVQSGYQFTTEAGVRQYVLADFARALEIETHELAEALSEIAGNPERDKDYSCGELKMRLHARAALARHRAKQEENT